MVSAVDVNVPAAGAASTANVRANFAVIKSEIEALQVAPGTGDVNGPASSVAAHIVTFDGTTGKLIQDSGSLISDLGDLAGPVSSTDNNIAVFNGVTGKIVKDSGTLIASLATAANITSAIVSHRAEADATAHPSFNTRALASEAHEADATIHFLASGISITESQISDLDKYAQAAVDALLLGKQAKENGFDNRTDSTFSFTDGTLTFEISPAVTSYVFYSSGTKYTKSAQETVVITDTEGLWFFYFDGSGVLISTQTFSPLLITTYGLVALGYWDATNNLMLLLADERHGNTMDSQTHLYHHNTVGALYGEGLLVGDVSVNGSGDVAADAQFSMTTGVIWDEDIELTISALATGVGAPIFYKDGAAGNWRKIAATGYISDNGGVGSRSCYNNPDGGGAGIWGLTEVTNNDFFCMHLIAVNDPAMSTMLMMGQSEYGTASLARDGAITELAELDTSGFVTAEFKSVATFIMQTSNGYSNAPKARVRSTDTGADYLDWRAVALGLAINVTDASLQIASQVPFTPAGSIAAVEVQAALEELDTEKGDVAGPGAAVVDERMVVWDGVSGALIKDAGAAYPLVRIMVSDGAASVTGNLPMYKNTAANWFEDSGVSAASLSGLTLNNLVATTDPVVGDDNLDGYSVGSVWINVTTDIVFKCVDASTGAAIWKQMAYVDDIPPHPAAFA